MASNGGDWSPKKLRALMGLVTNTSVSGASEASGVPTRSLYRWLKNNDFRRDLHVIREYINMYSLNYLRSTKVFVIDQLKEIMADTLVDAKDKAELGKWFLEFLQNDPVITPRKEDRFERPNDAAEDWLRVEPEDDPRWEKVGAEADRYEDEQKNEFLNLSDEELAQRIKDLEDDRTKVDKLVDENKDEEVI